MNCNLGYINSSQAIITISVPQELAQPIMEKVTGNTRGYVLDCKNCILDPEHPGYQFIRMIVGTLKRFEGYTFLMDCMKEVGLSPKEAANR